MTVPYSASRSFSINDTKFYAYEARDCHGSACSYFTVKGQTHTRADFSRECLLAFGDGVYIVRSIFAVELALGQAGAPIPPGRAEFTVNGTAFGVTVAPERPQWREMTVNGQVVGYETFTSAVANACRPIARLVGDYLRCLVVPVISEARSA